MKIALISLAVVVGLVVLGTLLTLTGYGQRYFLAPFRGAVEQQEITNTGAFRIQVYNRFYDWQEEMEAIDVKLISYVSSPSLSDRETTECRGLLARRANIVGDYNAAVRAVNTTGKWRGSGLPNRLNHVTINCHN